MLPFWAFLSPQVRPQRFRRFWSPVSGVPPTQQFSATPAGCPVIQLSADPPTWRQRRAPQGEGSVPRDCPPLQMPIANGGGPRVTHDSG